MTLDERAPERAVLDDLFAAPRAEVVTADGAVVPLPVDRWKGEADAADHSLFVRPCTGATLDVGCGPGRLTHALTRRRVPALGVDVSAEAVRQARTRGAPALCRDVFDAVPGAGTWRHALLADGNIGIGGDPVRLLRRVAELLHPRGTLLAEVEPHGTASRTHWVRLRVRGCESAPFPWARVSIVGVTDVAHRAGMVVRAVHEHDGRHVAVITRGE
ncbi:methyltransferase domain-containing protein [Mumia qirimensis]|uniref:methyltransferase domain-containing protein n=1 Tax=Mumia qirimensis TaxID=3234852 RepID=UPI00351D5076